MRQVSENLYIGGLRSPEKADKEEIDRVISLHLEVNETTHAHPIVDGEHDYKEFKKAVADAMEGLENDEKVLVHCQRGRSRSVSVATIALSETEDYSTYEALEMCKLADDQVPNNKMLQSVIRYNSEKQR